MKIKNFIFLSLAAFILPFIAFSNGVKNFNPELYQQLKSSNKSFLMAVHADWCPTCTTQQKIFDVLLKDEKLQNVIVLRVDFDKEKSLLKELKINTQSTLIAFQGKDELGRSVGDTKEQNIKALLGKVAGN